MRWLPDASWMRSLVAKTRRRRDALAHGFISRHRALAAARVQARLVMNTFGRAVRVSAKRFFAHALALPMTFYSQRSAGEIAARVDLNERVAETISADLAHLGLDFLTASFFLVLMVRLEPRLAVVVVGCLALELFAWRALARRTAEASQELSVQAGKLAGMATGGLANIESVKAGGQETALFLKWIGLQVQFVNASIRAQRYLLTLGQAPAILGLVAHLAVLGLGIDFIMEGGFTVGDLVAFQVLLAGFGAPVHALFTHTQKLQTLRGDLARLDDVLHHDADDRIDVYATSEGIPAPPIAGTVEFRNVTFGYSRGEPPLIEDFSLTGKAGAAWHWWAHRGRQVDRRGSPRGSLAMERRRLLTEGARRAAFSPRRRIGHVDQDDAL